MAERLVWERDGAHWPNRGSSRFVRAAGFRWHVQQMGIGPALLLIHGTGAATHTWRDLAPLLAHRFRVIAPDLPGHGFTEAPMGHRLSLPQLAHDLSALLGVLEFDPQIVAGHSAGAAILARMCLDGTMAPRHLVGLNAALLPLAGVPGLLFSPIARMLCASAIVPRLFAWRSRDLAAVRRLVQGTGSTLDEAGVALYGKVMRSRAHAAAALDMMASWDLVPLQHELPKLQPRLTLIVGSNDQTIRPGEAAQVRALLPSARILTLPGLGHLAHEERPEEVARIVEGLAASRREPANQRASGLHERP